MQTALRRSLCALIAVGTVAGGAVTASADPSASVYYVNAQGQDVSTCGTSPYFTCASIQYAIDNRAADGDTVQVAAGTYPGIVSVDKAITLTGQPGATIDASGEDLSAGGTYPIVAIGSVNGPVTVSGFTITGATAPPNNSTQVGVQVSGATTAVTISGTTITAVGDGIDTSADTAETTITGNTVTATNGITTSSNTADTAITGNTVSGTNGIDVDAGTGTATATVTGNTITLGSGTSGGLQGAAAITLTADTNGSLAVSLGGNTGQVPSPTATVAETGAGTVTVTPTDTPNTIDLATPPTFTFGLSSVLVPDSSPPSPIASTVSTSDATVPRARVDVSITSPNNVDHSGIYLSDGTTPISLSGSTASGAAITGSLDAAGGESLSPSAARAYNLNLDVDKIAYGSLTFTFQLDEVSRSPISGTDSDHVVLNTIAAVTHTTLVRNNHAPVPTTKAVTIAFNAPATPITLTGTDPDGDQLSYDVESATHGTFVQPTAGSPAITFQPTAGYVGPASITYTVSNPYGLSTEGTVSITVAAAVTTMSVAISPTTPNAGQVPTANVTVTSAGTVNGGTVSINLGTVTRTATVANGKASLLLVHYTGGAHTVIATFAKTSTAQAASASRTFTVTKVTPTLSFATNPAQLTTKTRNGRATVRLTAPGLSITGVKVTIKEGSRVIGTATLSANAATITLPALTIGQHNWTISYPGSTTTNAVTKSVTVRVALG